MKRFSYHVLFFSLLFVINAQAQLFTRTAEIKEPSKLERGFGGVISGVDFDRDGRPEIYACNTNMVDGSYELIPRIYKFELNPVTAKWDSVWSATAPLTLQNTWPAFAWGDLDKDGKPEIYWAPCNYSPYPDLPRILVYEYPGDGSDNMGVSDGLGGFMPNASTNIEAGAGINLRPVKFVIADPDGDGTNELIFADRNGLWKMGILSVNNIPDLGGGGETWTTEFKGSSDAIVSGVGSCYDVAVLNNTVYIMDSAGKIVGAKYSNGTWAGTKVQTKAAGGNGSFKGSVTVDINKDGTKEILLAEWLGNAKGQGAKVWLLQQDADTLKSTAITDLEPLGAVRLNGAGAGDLDRDGNLDFVCAARYDANNSKKVPIFRVEYQGGDITSSANYISTVIDSAYWTSNGDMDVVSVGNVDGDPEDEVLYTQGYSRGNSNDDAMALVVIDKKFTAVPIEIKDQLFTRTAEIKEPSKLERGFGGVISGVDFDKDGRPEIYACNTNMVDGSYELIPRIYKFELNPVTAKWDSVWSATAPLTAQNTWPAFAWGDLDKDGKPEIYWAPVNYSPYPDLPRILVYEYPGDGSDNMGVSDGLGGFMPNASTNIEAGAGINLRPVKFVIADPDGDGTNELIFADRNANWKLGILSVNNIPDLGGGGETWTTEFKGSSDAGFTSITSCYDVAVLNNIVYVMDIGGRVAGAKFANGVWTSTKLQRTVAGGNGSFKGSVAVDIDKDGTKEILLAEWLGNAKGQGAKVWLLQQNADTLKSTAIADLEPLGAVRLNGADAGDLDGDGRLDFVCAARYDANNSKKVPIFRVEYQGGDITAPFNYTASVIDSAYWTSNGDMDVVSVGNVDGDPQDEVMYTQGYSRGNSNDDPMPLVILDKQYTVVSVKKLADSVPADYYLEQNYPNPFNPTTQIKFGITKAAKVELKVFDVLGRVVATLVDNEYMTPGSYNVEFRANKLASGVYIYFLNAGGHTTSKKMLLLK